MKRIVKQILVLMLVLGSAQLSAMIAKKCNDLILILDPNKDETIAGKKKAMAVLLITALQEKVAPIIISSSLVENFCYWKTEHVEVFESIKQEALKTQRVSPGKRRAQQVWRYLKDSKKFGSADFLFQLSGTDLSDNDWDCYTHKQANLVLLIPKNYSAQRAQLPGSIVETCGFSGTCLDKIVDVSPQSVLQHIQSNKIKKPTKIVDAIQLMFALDNLADVTWNIYISGHGGPAKKKKVLEERLKEYQELLKILQESAKATNERGDLKWVESNVKNIKLTLKKIEHLQSLLQSVYHLPSEAVVPQSAHIAGISFDDFVELMGFFNSGIQTNFLYYSTCFAGGYNQTFINDVLQKLKVNFIVSSEGSSEAIVTAWAPEFKFNKNKTALVLSRRRFTYFFELLESFFGDPIKFVGMKMPLDWKKNPIAAIVGTVTDLSFVGNQPFVRIPAVGVFTAFSVDSQVKILTNSVVKAHELEGRTIDFTHSGAKTLIVYPAYIGVPVKIAVGTNILSPTPQKIEQLYGTTHIFEEVISDSKLCYLISNFTRLNSSYSKITFIFKKLTCFNYGISGLKKNEKYLSIENMIIQITGRLVDSGVIDVDVGVAFMLDGKAYSFFTYVIDLKSDEWLTDTLQNLQWTSFDDDLVDYIVGSENIEKLKEKSVPAMVEYFENKIDKTSGVQQVGSFKKVIKNREAIIAQKKAFEEKKKMVDQLMIKNLESQKEAVAAEK